MRSILLALCTLVACSSVVQAQCVNGVCRVPAKVVKRAAQAVNNTVTYANSAVRAVAQPRATYQSYGSTGSQVSYGSTGSQVSYGSTGSQVYPVAQPVAPVAQPVEAPPLPQVMEATAPPVMEASILRGSDSRAFKANLLKVAREARKNGDITHGQYLALAVAVQRPAVLEEMRVGVQDSLVQDGLHDGVKAIDWSMFWSEILKYLPDLIALFFKQS